MSSIDLEIAQDTREKDIEGRLASLETAPTGQSFTRKEFYILSLLGLVAPSLLLVWGWA